MARGKSSSRSPPPEVIMRLPFTEWMNRSAKARKLDGELLVSRGGIADWTLDFVATMGEFMGTTMFLL